MTFFIAITQILKVCSVITHCSKAMRRNQVKNAKKYTDTKNVLQRKKQNASDSLLHNNVSPLLRLQTQLQIYNFSFEGFIGSSNFESRPTDL